MVLIFIGFSNRKRSQMHDFNMENSARALGHFWSESMAPPTLSALSDLKLSQASPPAPSTPLKQWALFQLNRQSTNKGKFMKGERSDICSAVPLQIRASSPGALLPFLSTLCSQTCLQRHLLIPGSKEIPDPKDLLAGQTFIYRFTSIFFLTGINPLAQLSQQQLPNRSPHLWESWHLSFTSQCCPKILGTTIAACNLFQGNSTEGKSLTFTLLIPCSSKPTKPFTLLQSRGSSRQRENKTSLEALPCNAASSEGIQGFFCQDPIWRFQTLKGNSLKGLGRRRKSQPSYNTPQGRAGRLEVPRSWLGSIQHIQNAPGSKRTDTRDTSKTKNPRAFQ